MGTVDFREVIYMLLALLLALILIALLGGFGFAAHALWIVAVVLLVLVVAGALTRGRW